MGTFNESCWKSVFSSCIDKKIRPTLFKSTNEVREKWGLRKGMIQSKIFSQRDLLECTTFVLNSANYLPVVTA
jgi:hypothetical protein